MGYALANYQVLDTPIGVTVTIEIRDGVTGELYRDAAVNDDFKKAAEAAIDRAIGNGQFDRDNGDASLYKKTIEETLLRKQY